MRALHAPLLAGDDETATTTATSLQPVFKAGRKRPFQFLLVSLNNWVSFVFVHHEPAVRHSSIIGDDVFVRARLF
jgi:hypothetical protein